MNGRGELTRDKKNGKIAGVCAGVAEYFGIETWLVRILTITAFLLGASPFVVVAYVAAWFILDEKPQTTTYKSQGFSHKGFVNGGQAGTSQNSAYVGKGHSNPDAESHHKVEVKAKVWQAGLPPRQAFMDIKQRYSVVEEKLRRLESYVTSNEFQLNREINRL